MLKNSASKNNYSKSKFIHLIIDIYIKFITNPVYTLQVMVKMLRKKQIILILLLNLLNIFVCFSQNEWAPIGAKWYYNGVKGSPHDHSYVLGESIGDTIIQGKICKVLSYLNYYNGEFSSFGKPEFIYSDSDRVYHFDKFYQSFYTLYDFSANIGDTLVIRDSTFFGVLHLEGVEFQEFRVVVLDKDTILVNNKPLRRLITSFVSNTDFFFNSIIEYLGSTTMFFGSETSQPLPYQWYGGLRCYTDENINYKPVETCEDTLATNVGIPNNSSTIELYPNPAQDVLYINNLSKDREVLIYDKTGKVIIQKYISQKDNKLAINDIPKGLYIFKIIFNDVILHKRFFKN